MVHRKSTYKLTYKNVNPALRKSIWEENSVLRQNRRIIEMSHQSLEDSEDECECECDSEDETDSEKGKEPDTKKETTNDHARSEKSEKNILFNDKNTDRIQSKKLCSESSSDGVSTKQALNPTLESSFKITNMNNLNYLERETVLSPEVRKYGSEPHLEKLRSSSPKNRGVLKFTKTTGELDLIPARLRHDKRGQSASLPQKTSHLCRRHDRNIINMRPRSSILSMGRSSNKNVQNGRVTFSDTDQNEDSKRRELKSTRKEPRIGGSSKEKFLRGDKDFICLDCGKEMRKRGIFS